MVDNVAVLRLERGVPHIVHGDQSYRLLRAPQGRRNAFDIVRELTASLSAAADKDPLVAGEFQINIEYTKAKLREKTPCADGKIEIEGKLKGTTKLRPLLFDAADLVEALGNFDKGQVNGSLLVAGKANGRDLNVQNATALRAHDDIGRHAEALLKDTGKRPRTVVLRRDNKAHAPG